MTTQDSDSEITGKVAASLTPPVVRARAARGEQSSGFFDLDTLYAIHVEQVRPPRIPPPLPLPVVRDVRPPVPLAVPVDVRPVAARRAPRPQPIGWFAVFVTWLATATLATLSATQITSHGTAHARLLGTPASASAPAPTPIPAATPAPTLALTPVVPPAPSTPVLSVSDLPRVLPRALPPTRRAVPPATIPSPETNTAPAPVTEPAPAPTTAKPPPAAAPASTADLSLEDLIRHEVAAEQKRLRPRPAP